LTQTA